MDQTIRKNTVLKTRRDKIKLIAAAGVGNFLEIFDFTVYSFFAAVIADVFFPTEDKLVGLLFSVSVFGVGFLMRPLGSIMIGSYADKHGRKAAMLLTILLMAIGSILIGFAPTPGMVGIAAPFFIVIGRLLQGFSAGGETGAATTLLMESASREQRGFFVSWQFIGQALSSLSGSLLAALLMSILTTEQLNSWGWRVPFILALLVIPVGLYIRAHINETLDTENIDTDDQDPHPFVALFSRYLSQTFFGILCVLPVTALMYILIFFMPNYLQNVTDLSKSDTFLVSSYASVIMLIFAMFSGFLCDKLERRKKAALITLLIAFLSSGFAFHFVIQTGLFLFFYTIAIACLGIVITMTILMIMEAFPKKMRATATAVIYAFSVSIFGGTAQVIVTYLLKISDKNIMAPFWYLGTAILIGAIAVFFFREDRHEI